MRYVSNSNTCIFIENSQVNAEHEDAAAKATAATAMVLRRLKSMVALVVCKLLRREIMAMALSMELQSRRVYE